MDLDLTYCGSKREGEINIKMYLKLLHILLSRSLYNDRLAGGTFITSRAKQIQAIFHLTSMPSPAIKMLFHSVMALVVITVDTQLKILK